jgi:hypothetical protein
MNTPGSPASWCIWKQVSEQACKIFIWKQIYQGVQTPQCINGRGVSTLVYFAPAGFFVNQFRLIPGDEYDGVHNCTVVNT